MQRKKTVVPNQWVAKTKHVQQEIFPFENLPSDIKIVILNHLDLATSCILRVVSKSLRTIIDKNKLILLVDATNYEDAKYFAKEFPTAQKWR